MFCILFGAVYELFSHEVYSYWMIYAFAIPLLLGFLPQILLALRSSVRPREMSVWAWNAGIAAMTVGCIFKGVLDIYGTTNPLLLVYPAVAVILMLIGGVTGGISLAE